MSKKIIISFIVCIVFFGAGFFSGRKTMRNAVNSAFQAGWGAAKERLKQTQPSTDAIGIRMANGSIEKKDGNKLSVKIKPLEPLADPSLDERVIVLTSTTKVYSSKSKSPEDFQKEMDEYQANLKSNPDQISTLTPPSPIDKKEVDASELKVGSEITIFANENIKDTKQFDASEIDVQ